jgi:hypothetical protein
MNRTLTISMKILRTAFEIPELGKKIRDARFDAKKTENL